LRKKPARPAQPVCRLREVGAIWELLGACRSKELLNLGMLACFEPLELIEGLPGLPA